MILPQVHLRKPCYDFTFIQSVGATGGVYKGQGRNQHALMKHTY